MSFRDLVVAALQEIGADVRALTAADTSVRADAPRVARAAYVPRVGWSISGGMLLGSQAGTPVFQRLYLTPFPVGPVGWQADAALVSVSTAYSGGTGVGFSVALYPDDGSGFPNLAGGPVAQSSTTSLGTGTKALAFAAPVTLLPGLYWAASLVTGTAAPSAGQMQCVTNNAYQLGLPSGLTPGTTTRAYVVNGQTALPTAQPADSAFSISGGNDAPFVAVRRSG